jgi:hypothetical protein
MLGIAAPDYSSEEKVVVIEFVVDMVAHPEEVGNKCCFQGGSFGDVYILLLHEVAVALIQLFWHKFLFESAAHRN